MPTFFKRWSPKKRTAVERIYERDRGTTAERGYDFDWQKVRVQHQKNNPFCEECKRRGRLEPMTVVDHIIPIRHAPERRLDHKNLQSLCDHHHSVWKQRMERYAEKAHKVDDLIEWCKNPESRPKPFRIASHGSVAER